MKSILGPTGRNLIRSLAYTRTLFAFDFDGTLAPIVAVPDRARIRSATLNLLNELNSRKDLAIISGRSIADLKNRMGLEPRYVIGNHGLEGLPKSRFDLAEAQMTCEHWSQTIERRLENPKEPGLWVEHKRYSLAIHYRHCKNKKKVRAGVLSCVESLAPKPRIIPGKDVINVIPKEAPHKGFALQALMKEGKYEYALFVGDDDTDEDVFSLMDESILSIRIGKTLKSNAQYYLKDQSEINAFLKLLLENKA